ncbi:pentapeptide repeat-containing protein [Pectobacterium versatile]|uniref:pentapeptide repeat-containing protein n=1 Tax=Pectobacterium versatile TaxID=2488639 RepID=UPI000CDE7987|nr:pentapeptide repeat-containing protein [Pectobacterium versatile]MBA0164719.1 pentapeptide repeat-containing protein [Pectobacterium versatile]MBN3059926.1 pentapeptide repeat-containing protein [Pectobacterium versatile]POY56468.1 hypothetical protein F018LOC_00403 [Pectobacterium versatile]
MKLRDVKGKIVFWYGKLQNHPMKFVSSVFVVFFAITVFVSLLFPVLSKYILPEFSIGIYNKNFWDGVLVNLNSSLIDFLFFGLLLFYFQDRNSRNKLKEQMIDELGDISKYNDPQVNLKKIGLFRRLNELGIKSFSLQRMELSGEQIEIISLEFIDSDFIGARMESIYMNNVFFKNTNLHAVNFDNTIMKNVVFENCKLSNVKMNNVKCKNVAFKGCDFTGSVLSNGQFKSCDFRRGRFEKAKFIGANLNRANMRDCLYINAEDISQAKDINYLVADVDIINELKRINRDNIKYYQIRNTA